MSWSTSYSRRAGRLRRLEGLVTQPSGDKSEEPLEIIQVSLQNLVDDFISDNGGLVRDEVAETGSLPESVDQIFREDSLLAKNLERLGFACGGSPAFTRNQMFGDVV